MAFKIRRGYDSERLTITPAEGELIYTVDTKNLYVGDGATVGGILVGSSGSGGGGGLQGVQGIQGLEGPQGLPGGGGGGGNLSNVTTDIIPDTDVTYNIGSPSKKFKDLYLSSDTIYLGEKSLSVKDNKLELGGVRFGFNGNVNGFVSATWNANTVVIRAETNSPADAACQNIVIGDKLKLDNDPNYVGISVLNVSSAPSAALDELDPVFIDFTFNVDATSINPDTSISFELVKPIGSPSITSLLDPDGLLPDVSVPGWPYYEVPLGVNVLVGDTNVSIIPSWDRQIVSFDFTESGVLKLPLGGDIQDQEGNSLLTQGSSAQGIQGAQGTQGLQGTTAGPTYNITYDSDNNTYLISGYPNASLYLLKGFTYYFNVNAPGYPVFIKTEPTSGLDNVYANGVINNGTDNGTIEFTVPLNSPDTLYYVNIVNPNMNGLLTLSETGLQGLPGQSIQGIQGITGPSGIDGISFVYLGSFDPDITYELNQVVFWEGSSYVFISNTPANGQYPTYSDPPLVNDLFWGILTSKGVQGIQGTNGVDGIDGGQGLQGIPGQDGSQGLQGTEGTSIIYRGDYNPTYPYYPNDIVSYLGNSYIFVNINSSIGQDPAYGDPPATNFNYWNPISARGAQGIQGEQGIQGIQGIQGDIGLSGASFYWAGTWDNTVEYYPNDVVFYNGSSYIATAVSINTDPELVAGAWNIISQKGSVGAQGEIGAQGVQGVQGSVGQGFRIAKIFSSLANLEADTGAGIAPGEFVLIDTGDPNNSDNSKLYVWNGSSYSFVTDLSGAVGIQGTEGSIGPVGPQGPIGIGTTWRGEWDLNTEYTKNDIISFVNSSYIYVNNTPSTGNVPIYLSTSIINADYWNLISRQGEIGLQGTQGIQGEQGFQGIQGVQGMDGQTGFQGIQGTSGPPGIVGFSGEQGIQGITGEAGVAGEQGIQGTTGITGNQGIQGIQGVGFNYLGAYDPSTTYNKNDVIFYQGSSFIFVNLASTSNELPLVGDPLVLNDFYWNYLSNQGIQGIVGDTGPQGEPGIQGIQGTSGVDGMSGAQGIQGVGFNYRDGYDSSVEYSKNDVVSYNGSSYIYTFSQPTTGNEPAFGNSGTTNTLYWSTVSSQGIQGIQGTDGFQGIQGEQGVQGVQGEQGVQGVQGVQGEQGIQGIQGIQGEKGEQGAQGEQGPIGLTGPEGLLGAQGPDGVQGIQGIQGEQGVQGIQGEQGFQGVQGIQGESIQGIQGEQGIQGAQGVQGIQGVGSDPLTAVASNILPDLNATYNIGATNLRFKDLYLSSNTINLSPSSFVIEPSGNTKIETAMQSSADWTTTGEVVFYVDNLSDEDDRILKLKKGDTINVQTASETLPSTPQILTLTGGVTGAGVPYNDPNLGQGISYTVPVSLSASQLTFILTYTVSQYHVTSADQLLDPTGLLGSQGIQGIQGLDGPSGGPQGVQGIQGATGITGNQGVQGVQGIAGEYAGQGIQGIQGATGITGNQGVQGVQGIAGEYAGQGIQGIQGEQGIQGIQGIQSADGAQGIQGLQGIQGADGPTSNTLSNGSYTVALGNTGSIIYPGEVTQSHKYGTTCPQNVDTVVYTATGDLQNAIKLFVIIEGLAGGTNYDTQACDVIAVKGNNSNIVYVTTYGVTYSSTAAFATFDGRLNPVTNRIEITCRPTSTTNPVYVGVHAIEITSID